MGSIGKNLLDPGGFIFKDDPAVPQLPEIPSFKGLTTPGFSLQPDGSSFNLTRTTDTNARFGELANLLSSNQGGFLNQLQTIQGLQGQTAGLQQQAGGFGGRFAGLGQQIAGTQSGLDALGQQAGGIGGKFAGIGQQLSDVQSEIRPGFGRLTEAQVAALRNREAQSAGNLRDALNRRNLGGSSLALQEGRRNELDFAQQEAEIRGDAFQTELAATRDIAALRGQILAGELGSVQEQRAVIADTRATINNVGALMQLEQGALQQQASLIGLQLGLSEAQSTVFSNSLANIQVQMQQFQQQIANELNELGIAGNIINQVQAMATEVGISQARLTAEAAAAAGFADQQQRSQLLSIGGTIAGSFFGGPAGGAVGGAAGSAVAANTSGSGSSGFGFGG